MSGNRWIVFVSTIVTALLMISDSRGQFRPLGGLFAAKSAEQFEKLEAAAHVPVERIPPAIRPKIQQVLKRPTIYSKGPREAFFCQAGTYYWLLDHPDRTMVAWRRLGARCIEITNRGNGEFGWADDKGSDISWRVVHAGPDVRVWYAEGKVNPGPLLPTIPVQCVVVLRHKVVRRQKDVALMEHQVDVFTYTNSRTAAVVTRLLGPSVPRLAKQATAQLQMFFAAMAWYCQQNPDRVKELFRPPSANEPANTRTITPLKLRAVKFPVAPGAQP